jgi:hypothetical protein
MALTISEGAGRSLSRRAGALIVLAILTIYGFEAHARRHEKSTPAILGDQSAYLGYARHLSESNYTVTEDRNRMPVYPFLLSLIYRPGMTDDQFLSRAQTFTVNLSIVLLLLLFLVFRKFFPPLHAIALLAATAFGVFIYRAGKAQAEVLFYFLGFCAFVLLLQMLIKPRWWLALLAGATMGLAHLTKASVLPALIVWAVVFAAQIFWSFRAQAWRRLGMLALVLGAFLGVVFPYIQTSKRIYGSYFYNVNSTFVMWCDSSTEAYEFLSAHGDKDQWRALPPDQLPSFGKYWREHSVAQIGGRIWSGAVDLTKKNLRVIGYYKYVLALLVAAAFLCVKENRRARDIVSRHPFATLFALLFLAGYYLLFAWYYPISKDVRFVLSIFLPFMFVGSLFLLNLADGRVVSIAGGRMQFAQFFAGLLLALSVIDVFCNVPGLFY